MRNINIFFISNALVCALLLSISTSAQNPIMYDLSDDGLYEDLLLKSGPTTTRNVNIAILYYQDDIGNGPTKSISNDNKVMTALSTIYGSHKLTFTKVKSVVVELTDTQYAKTEHTNYVDQATGVVQNIDNGLNIILADNPWHPTRENNIAGWASVNSYECMFKASYLSSSASYFAHLIGHEAGHAFGLHHTFRGTGYRAGCSNRGDFSSAPASDICRTYGGCEEYVDNTVPGNISGKTNGETCGDKIPDTPADPNTWSGGVYNPIVTDNGVAYSPLADNIMSYNGGNTHGITDDQANVCHRWVMRIEGFGIDLPISMSNTDTYTCGYINSELYPVGIFPPNHIGQYYYPKDENVPPMWQITNTGGNVSIDQNGKITVHNSTYGIETVTLNYRWYLNSTGYLHWYYRTVTKTIIINPTPPAPTISYAYNMDTYQSVANPLDVGTMYRFTMSNCGSSSSNYDYEWEATCINDFIFKDVNQSVVSDDGVANGKTCYIEVFEEDEFTLKGRYRASSTGTWSSWGTRSLTFTGGEMMMMIAPNPVSLTGTTEITVESTNADEPLDYNEGWDIEVYNINYGKKVNEKVKKKDYKLKTHGWKAGTYIVVAKYKDKQVTGKLKVE